jgi:hypothetical protein
VPRPRPSLAGRLEADESRPQDRFVTGSWLTRALRHPADSVGLLVAVAVTGAVLVNALFLQSGPHPAPMFGMRSRPVSSGDATGTVLRVLSPRPRPAELSGTKPETSPGPRPQPAARSVTSSSGSSGRNDAIGELIVTSSRRVLAIQRALSDFGYGPIKPNGVFGTETKVAIEKFERDRKMTVTGQISERMMRELAAVTGRTFE